MTAQTLEQKALDCARLLCCLHLHEGRYDGAAAEFTRRFADSPNLPIVKGYAAPHVRAAVPAATPTQSTWASSLVPAELAAALVLYGQAFSAADRLGLMRSPFYTRIVYEQAAMTAGGFTSAGDARLAVAGNLASTLLTPFTMASFAVVTNELLRLARPNADLYVRDTMARSLAAGLDRAFFRPVAGVADTSPAGVTYNAPSVAGGGSPADADAAIADLQELIDLYVERGGSMTTAAFAMSSTLAAALALSDRRAFAGVQRNGGVLAACPLVCSDSIGDQVCLIDTGRVLFADDDTAEITFAENASLELADTSSMDARTGTGTNTTSMYQTHSVAIRATRRMTWEALPGSVAVITNANYTGVSTGSPA